LGTFAEILDLFYYLSEKKISGTQEFGEKCDYWSSWINAFFYGK
jgi:hypothetical protein